MEIQHLTSYCLKLFFLSSVIFCESFSFDLSEHRRYLYPDGKSTSSGSWETDTHSHLLAVDSNYIEASKPDDDEEVIYTTGNPTSQGTFQGTVDRVKLFFVGKRVGQEEDLTIRIKLNGVTKTEASSQLSGTDAWYSLIWYPDNVPISDMNGLEVSFQVGNVTTFQSYLLDFAAFEITSGIDVTNADATILGKDASDLFGYQTTGVGDVNNDGKDDIIVTSKYRTIFLGPDPNLPTEHYLESISKPLWLGCPATDKVVKGN